MKHMMTFGGGIGRVSRSFLLGSAILLGAFPMQGRGEADEINRRLGRGINMGNMFEAPAEQAWGNPWQSGYFKQIAELGFQHVRLPVRWEPAERSLAEAPYTIRPEFLERIRQVVEEALSQKLLVVLNMHHHEALYEDPDGQRERFLRQWQQIAGEFKAYPDSLVFELLNEPHGKLTAEKWNLLLAEGVREIRKTNPTRAILIGTAEWGGLSALSKLVLPEDRNIILTVHYYQPFEFTHQGAEWTGASAQAWLGTRWLDRDAERETIRRQFQPVIDLRAKRGIPVHVGEFGAYSKADMASRVRWTRFLARYFEEQRFSWAYWEFSAGFGIYDPKTRELRQPLVNALLRDPLPEAARTHRRLLMRSDYSGGMDSWILHAQGGAKASAASEDGRVLIAIENGGKENWHVQWMRPECALEKGRNYRVVFRASSSASRPLQAHMGMHAAPWTAYSGYSSFTLSREPAEFSFDFTMRADSDPKARMVFDLGASTHGVVFHEIRLEEIEAVREGP